MSNTAIYIVGGLAAAGIGLAAYDFLTGGQIASQLSNLQQQQQTLQGTGGPTFNVPVTINPYFSPTFTPSYQVSAPVTTTISPNTNVSPTTLSSLFPGGIPTGVVAPPPTNSVTTVPVQVAPPSGGRGGGGGGGSGGVITAASFPVSYANGNTGAISVAKPTASNPSGVTTTIQTNPASGAKQNYVITGAMSPYIPGVTTSK